jgi:hypothetical protein
MRAHTTIALLHSVGRRAVAAAAAALVALLHGAPAAASDPLPDQTVKVAFIYNFAKFVQWPADAFATAQSPLVLCTASRGPGAAAFAAIEGKSVQGRDLKVRREVRPEELRGCHILFLPGADPRGGVEYVRAAATLPVLTVGEAPGFAADGGMIGFVLRDDRLQFEINQEVATRAGLRVSAQLMRLAMVVGETPRSRP